MSYHEGTGAAKTDRLESTEVKLRRQPVFGAAVRLGNRHCHLKVKIKTIRNLKKTTTRTLKQ